MKKLKKPLLLLLTMLSFLIPVVGVEAGVITVNKRISADAGVVPFADSIVKQYRVYHGQLQYRRWNETRGYWVDSAWINV